MDKPPAFQFYGNDYMRGTSTFTLAEKGGYVDLLCHQWDDWEGRGVPGEDIKAIARIMRCDVAEAKKVWPKVQTKFHQRSEAGLWQNPRIEKERQKLLEFRQVQSEKGKASAAAKAAAKAAREAQHGNRGSTGVATAVQPVFQPKGQPDVNHSRLQPEVNSSSSSSSSDLIERNTSDRSPSDGRALWSRIIEELEISEKNKKEFFEPCEVYSYEPGRLTINARKSFIAGWLNQHFWKRVREVASAIEPGLRVDLITKSLSVGVR